MGLPDLGRSAVTTLLRGRTAVLLVAATLLAELVDLVGCEHAHAGASVAGHGGSELLASIVGVCVAAVAGWAVERPSDRHRPGARFAGRAVPAAGALLLALTAHELVAVGLHAEHGAGAGALLRHLAETVLPLAVGLGLLVGLVAGVQVVHRVVEAVRRPAFGGVLVAPARTLRLLVVAADAVPAGRLSALRLAGRAPPAARR